MRYPTLNPTIRPKRTARTIGGMAFTNRSNPNQIIAITAPNRASVRDRQKNTVARLKIGGFISVPSAHPTATPYERKAA